jgi:hypothetical protein
MKESNSNAFLMSPRSPFLGRNAVRFKPVTGSASWEIHRGSICSEVNVVPEGEEDGEDDGRIVDLQSVDSFKEKQDMMKVSFSESLKGGLRSSVGACDVAVSS